MLGAVGGMLVSTVTRWTSVRCPRPCHDISNRYQHAVARSAAGGVLVSATLDAVYPNHLAAERTAAGFVTAASLADRVGIDAAWYAHIEAGRVLPTLAQLD